MKKLLLSAVATAALLTAAQAAQTGWTGFLPPTQYDVPYKGELIIWLVNSPKDILTYCIDPRKLACAVVPRDLKRCSIYLLRPELKTGQGGASFAFTLRHELGHCNGSALADFEHKGWRKVPADLKVKMPELPLGTMIMRAAPPVVCLTPDWNEEPCADRHSVTEMQYTKRDGKSH